MKSQIFQQLNFAAKVEPCVHPESDQGDKLEMRSKLTKCMQNTCK